MKELLYEILREAKDGKIIIDEESWPIGFNSQIEENGKVLIRYENEERNAFLIIKREQEFLDLLEEYVTLELSINRKVPPFTKEKEKNTKKWIISYMFANFTTEDFLNPIESIRRKIDFLKDNTFSNFQLEIPLSSMDSVLKIENEKPPVSMETPNKMSFNLERVIDDKKYVYHLPSVYYGISSKENQKTCYIYAVLKKNEKEQLTNDESFFRSKMNRRLFELNSDVKDLEDFLSEEESNIRDVSMSFIYTVNAFLSLLQAKGIEQIKVVPYLPIRYHSRDIVARQLNREDLIERNNDIQSNLTNKLIRTFRRVSVQNKDVTIISFPMENDEYLTLNISKKQKELENMLLEEISEIINNTIKK